MNPHRVFDLWIVFYLRGRKPNFESCTPVFALAACRNLAAVKFDKVLYNGQSKAKSAGSTCVFVIGLAKPLNYEWQKPRFNSKTIVGYFDLYVRIGASKPNIDL